MDMLIQPTKEVDYMDKSCDLCARQPINAGKDILLYEDRFYYIVENGNPDGYARRISLVIVPHGIASPLTEQVAVRILREYITSKLHISNADYFIKKTMKTHPDHFHIHAYVLPETQ